jgi:hypothetical protein
MTVQAAATWSSDDLQTLVMLLSAVALLMHAAGQLISFFADWHKPLAGRSRESRMYPLQYKNLPRWRARGMGGVISLVLGVALLVLALDRMRQRGF